MSQNKIYLKYISTLPGNDSLHSVEYVFNELESLCLSLAEQAQRDHAPAELTSLGIKDYLEVHFKPYRVIYQMTGKTVYIYCVVDGRRDMRRFLEQRVLR